MKPSFADQMPVDVGTHDPYHDFLLGKIAVAPKLGAPVAIGDVSPVLIRHQPDIVRWAVEGGRRAIFANFGLGKTLIQLEILRLLGARLGGRQLIVAPLNVILEGTFTGDGAKIGVAPIFIKSTAGIAFDQGGVADLGQGAGSSPLATSQPGVSGVATAAGSPAGTLFITNYESVRDGKIDLTVFNAASLDEADCLRGFGGSKTFREFMSLFDGMAYKFVATATPSPNEYIELLAYAAFLEVMDVGQAKTRFFRRNSEKADELTLHPHKEAEFWLWVNSWAAFVQRPSDLGHSDEGYNLPPLDVRWHEVASDHRLAGADKSGQGRLLKADAIGVVDAAREKRDSLAPRIAKMLELRAEDPAAHRLIWHDLEAERHAISAVVPERYFGLWGEVKDGHPTVCALYDRHYSSRKLGEDRKLVLGPGDKMVLLTDAADATFGWRKFIDDSGQRGVNCAFFRNEGAIRSSLLIQHAMAAAWHRWPGERFYTYVDPKAIRCTAIPGKCFLKAGWRYVVDALGQPLQTQGGLLILEALPGVALPEVPLRAGLASVWGSQDTDERARTFKRFSAGEIPELSTKPVIAGAGCNFQKHCHWAIFTGIGFKFRDFIQAIHRIQRFLQPHAVRIDLIYTEAERGVRRELERKWRDHEAMAARMSEILRRYGLGVNGGRDAIARTIGVDRREERGDGWTAVHNDTVLETRAMASDSVGLIVTSVPFSTQYEYTPSYNDFGHNEDAAAFFAQMDHLTPELLRVLQPGRRLVVHVKDRIRPGGFDGLGFQTVDPFHADCIAHYRRHGFAYLGMHTVTTDVVRENAQTYRLGWSEQCKDGSRMGCGMPEYLLIFRRPQSDRTRGYADVPVEKPKPSCRIAEGPDAGAVVPWDKDGVAALTHVPVPETGYSRSRWQVDAAGYWRSSGDRSLAPEDLLGLPFDKVYQLFRGHNYATVYDHEGHVALCEGLERRWMLPVDFALLPAHSWHPQVWSDVARMYSLNGAQNARAKEMHLCPLPFDIVDRTIRLGSNPGDLVYDPFGGLMTVPLRAVRLGRRGYGVELNPGYFEDGLWHLRESDLGRATPSLFDLVSAEAEPPAVEAAE